MKRGVAGPKGPWDKPGSWDHGRKGLEGTEQDKLLRSGEEEGGGMGGKDRTTRRDFPRNLAPASKVLQWCYASLRSNAQGLGSFPTCP